MEPSLRTSLLCGLLVGALACWALAPPAAAPQLLGQAEHVPDAQPKSPKHKFGVDWHKIDQDRDLILWPAGIPRLIDKWAEFPDKAAEALRWGQVVATAMSVLTNILIAVIVYQLTAPPRK